MLRLDCAQGDLRAPTHYFVGIVESFAQDRNGGGGRGANFTKERADDRAIDRLAVSERVDQSGDKKRVRVSHDQQMIGRQMAAVRILALA